MSTSAEEIPEGLPQVGETLAGKYTIKRLIACGGMGAVYEVHHEILDQAVALKVLLPEAKEHTGAAARFINEAKASARIRNEHVAQVMDVGRLDNGSVYIVLELLRGSDLARLLEQRGRLPIEEAVDYVLQALEGLAEAHVLGIVHRDLKPANLFLAQREKGAPLVKLLDFGISKVIGTERKQHGDPITDSRALLGSPSYMSPEQVRSSKHIDARSDIWSIGVILYRLIAFQPPFEGDNLGTVLASILESTPTPIRQHRPEVPEGLEQVILRCLDRNRDTRYQSVDELAEALMPYAPHRARYSLERIRSTFGALSQRAPSHPDALPAAPAPALAESNGGKTAESWSENQRERKPGSPRLVAFAALGVTALGGAVVLALRSPSTPAEAPVRAESTSAAAAPERHSAAPSVTPLVTPDASALPAVSVAPLVSAAPAAAEPTSPVSAPSASARPKAPSRVLRPAKPGVDDSVLFNRK